MLLFRASQQTKKADKEEDKAASDATDASAEKKDEAAKPTRLFDVKQTEKQDEAATKPAAADETKAEPNSSSTTAAAASAQEPAQEQNNNVVQPEEQQKEQEQEQEEQKNEEANDDEEAEDEDEETQPETPKTPEPLPFTEALSLDFMLSLRLSNNSQLKPTNANKPLQGLFKGTSAPLNTSGPGKVSGSRGSSSRGGRGMPPRNFPSNAGQSSSLLAQARSSRATPRGHQQRMRARPQGAGAGVIRVDMSHTANVQLKRAENAFKVGEQKSPLSNLRGALGKITLDNFDKCFADEILPEAKQLLSNEAEFAEFVKLIHDTVCTSFYWFAWRRLLW